MRAAALAFCIAVAVASVYLSGYMLAKARMARWMAAGWNELARRALDRGPLDARDYVEVFGSPDGLHYREGRP